MLFLLNELNILKSTYFYNDLGVWFIDKDS